MRYLLLVVGFAIAAFGIYTLTSDAAGRSQVTTINACGQLYRSPDSNRDWARCVSVAEESKQRTEAIALWEIVIGAIICIMAGLRIAYINRMQLPNDADPRH